jgi:hypothetical protein
MGLAVELEMPRHPEPDLVQVRAAGTAVFGHSVVVFVFCFVCAASVLRGEQLTGDCDRVVGAELGPHGLGC